MVDPEVYVDINIFIYWLGAHPTFGRPAYSWIKRIEGALQGKYVTSSLTLYEATVIMAGLTGRSLKDKTFIEEIINSLISLQGLTMAPLSKEDATKAVELMKEYDLDYEDALHLNAALRNNVKEIISNDQDFDRTPLRRKFV